MPKRTHQDNEDAVERHVRLTHEAHAGQLEDLECPECSLAAVSVWFTHPAPDVYRTWFLCANCKFHTRAQNAEKPQFFSEERVDTELEGRDLAILRAAKFKRPPHRLM